MTREDDIRKLAEWMGFTPIEVESIDNGVRSKTIWVYKEYNGLEYPWCPFTRIEDAWFLVEKIKGGIYSVGLEWIPGTIGYHFDIWIENDFREQAFDGEAETAPEAICKAVLALIESEEK